ncbi:MAG: FtsQ-type POTRA domain-containing protein, partial [Propionibacteriales bacterium]|nr:FtsQ-type POTRA domain-containing protein [Propionibacteriales bacterium]
MSTRSKSSSRAVRRSGDNTVRPVRGAVINDMSERLGQRRRRSRRRVLITAAIVGCTLLLLGAAVFVIGFSPWVTARQVEVRGTNLLSQDQVREVAAVPIGQPLVRVDTDAVASRVGGLAPVSEVKVVRSWPYTVTITVIERTPVYVVEQKSSTGAKEFLVIDADGTPYTTVPSKPKGMLVATVT